MYADEIFFFILYCLGIVAFLIVIGLGANALNSYSCGRTATALGLEHEYSMFTGCIVTRKDGVAVPLENYGRSDRD